jgi:pimeloyl-ACP methyl ester carboxylesterase
VETGFVPAGDTTIYYQTEGTGPAVLFVHAGVADSRMWRDQMGLPGYTCIAFDQRGFGKTDWVPAPYSNRRDALSVLDHLDVEKATVVGCSNGAEAALQLALIAPDRVSALVLVGAAARGWEPAGGWAEPSLWEQIIAAYEAGDHAGAVRLEAQLWLAGPERPLDQLDPELVALFEEMDLIQQATESERDDHVETLEPPTNDRLDEITCPALVVVGEHDLADLIESAVYLSERLSGDRPVILERTAHLPSLEVPEQFNAALLGFLGSL